MNHNPEDLQAFLTILPQMYIAFVGIVSLLVVYRIENKANQRREIADRLRQRPFLRSLISGEEVYGISADELHDRFGKALGRVPSGASEQEKTKKLRHQLDNLRGVQGDKYKYLCDELNRIASTIDFSRRLRWDFCAFLTWHLIFGSIYLILYVVRPSIFSHAQLFFLLLIFLAGSFSTSFLLGLTLFDTSPSTVYNIIKQSLANLKSLRIRSSRQSQGNGRQSHVPDQEED